MSARWKLKVATSSVVFLAAALLALGTRKWGIILGLWAVVLFVPMGIAWLVLNTPQKRRRRQDGLRLAAALSDESRKRELPNDPPSVT